MKRRGARGYVLFKDKSAKLITQTDEETAVYDDAHTASMYFYNSNQRN